MNLRLALTTFGIFGIGIFSKAQTSKPKVENGPDAIPVTVKSSPKKKASTPKVTKFTPPVIVKDGDKKAPLPPTAPKQAVKKDLPAPPTPPKQTLNKDLPAPPPPPMEVKKATGPKKELPPPPPPPKAPKHKD